MDKLNYEQGVIFDIETNGLLDDLTTIHCISLCTGNSPVVHFNTDSDNIADGLKLIEEAPIIVGHNILGFDIPAIQLLYPSWKPKGIIRDTLVMSRLQRVHKMWKGHSMKVWGAMLNFPKDEWDDWSKWSPEMQSYCDRDVEVNRAILKDLLKDNYPEDCIQLEHDFASYLQWQMKMGAPFNEVAACQLAGELEVDEKRLREKLQEMIPPKKKYTPFTPKRDNKTRGYVKGQTIMKEEEIIFNPGSRPQIIKHLQDTYRWNPVDFTDKGNPKCTGAVLRHLPYEEADDLADYLDVKKLFSQVQTGDKSWLHYVKDGRIHGFVNHNGAVTGRCTHNWPNLAQVPRVSSFRGEECRGLFIAPPGYRLVGVDASGLELRNLAHYLFPYDNGRYTKIILEGDIHDANQSAAGLPNRDGAKRFIYAHNYGAGDEKLGSIVLPDAPKYQQKTKGFELRSKFMAEMPAFGTLIQQVKMVARTRGYIKGLDGRRLHVRSAHRALNTLLQGAGAVIMKKASVLTRERIQAEGLDAYPILHCHDEYQWVAREDHSERVGEIGAQAIRDAAEFFNYKCPLDAEYKVGANWSETH